MMVLGPGLALAQPAAPPPGHQHKPGAGMDAAHRGEQGGRPGEQGGRPGEQGGRPGEQAHDGKRDEHRPGEQAGKPGEAPHQKADEQKAGAPPGPRPADNSERAARRKSQVDKERPVVQKALKSRPMDDAFKQEMQRHAERVARLERIQKLAEQSGDTATAERAKKLLEQENARYSTYLSSRK